jgi:hypothetical protein
MTGLTILGRIDELEDLNKGVISSIAQELKKKIAVG